MSKRERDKEKGKGFFNNEVKVDFLKKAKSEKQRLSIMHSEMLYFVY